MSLYNRGKFCIIFITYFLSRDKFCIISIINFLKGSKIVKKIRLENFIFMQNSIVEGKIYFLQINRKNKKREDVSYV